MFTQKFIKIFHSVQEIGLFSLFQNLALGKASTNDEYHFAISWTRCRQYQCVCKISSRYSKRFKSYRHFSWTSRGQNLYKLSGDKIKCLIIGHSMKVNLQFQLTFLGSCNIGVFCSWHPSTSWFKSQITFIKSYSSRVTTIQTWMLPLVWCWMHEEH